MVEFSFDRDEFRPDPADRARDAAERERREREQDRARQEQQQRDDALRDMERDANDAAFRRVFNSPDISIPESLRDMINDPNMMIDRNMTIRRRRGQFRRDLLLPRTRTRTRKKTKTDRSMSKALREANARLRTKKGVLRKGKTQRDVMRLAHRLRKKM